MKEDRITQMMMEDYLSMDAKAKYLRKAARHKRKLLQKRLGVTAPVLSLRIIDFIKTRGK